MIAKFKNYKGITLIALVVTIIILLILAGVTISSLGEQGLFGKAKSAIEKSKEAEVDEKIKLAVSESLLKDRGELKAATLKDILETEYEATVEDTNGGFPIAATIDEISGTVDASGNVTTGGGSTGAWTMDEETGIISSTTTEQTIHVGDYVNYSPSGTLDTTQLISDLSNYSGFSETEAYYTYSPLTRESNFNWRVLDIDNDKIRLISESATTNQLYLGGADGYNNGVYLIDEMCRTLYNNSTYASNVQNLKIEDIEKYITNLSTLYNSSNVGTQLEWSGIYSYPNMFTLEKDIEIDGVESSGLYGKSEQNELVSGTSYSEESIKLKASLYSASISGNDIVWASDLYKTTIFPNNLSNAWLSSRGIENYYGQIGLFTIASSGISYRLDGDTGYTVGSNGSSSASVRPVVTLKTNVQITEGSGTGTVGSSTNPWELSL